VRCRALRRHEFFFVFFVVVAWAIETFDEVYA
jgi:hypothetical protein